MKHLVNFKTLFTFTCLCLLLFPPTLAAREEFPQGEWILARSEEHNRDLRDFSADLDISLYSYPLRFDCTGLIYFKKPKKVKLLLTSLPGFLRNSRSLLKSMVPAETLHNRYSCQVLGVEKKGEKECYVMKLIPPGTGNLREAKVWVEKETFLPLRLLLAYRQGGTLEIENSFSEKQMNRVRLMERQKMNFKIPGVRAQVYVHYRNYHINQNLPDSLFQDNEPVQIK
jgi:outer membrane lipoprotein-sorting protein